MEPRRVVHVFSTFGPGGTQRRTADVLAALPPNYRHTIFAIDNQLGARAMLRPGLPVEFGEVPKSAAGRVRRGALREAIAALRPDLMITYNWGAMEAIQAVAFRSPPTILHAQDGFGPDEARSQIPRRRWARRVFLRFCEALVVPSRNLERIGHEEWWLPRRRVLYIANGIEGARYRASAEGRARFRGEFEIPADALVVGMVAHLRREKNPARLARAFAAAAPASAYLVFVGDGPEREALVRTAAEGGFEGRVRFAGHRPDPLEAYQAFDVFALCSDTEQMPISVLEAMGVGIPVLSTDVGDVKSMVAPPNAPFVTPLSDEPAFAEALARLAADAGLRARLGEANRARCVSHYSLEQQNNAYRDLYDRFSGPRRLIWRSEHFRA